MTQILRVLQDIFLNFCGRISNSQPSLIRIHLQIEIYGMFSVCECQITFYSLRRLTLYQELKFSKMAIGKSPLIGAANTDVTPVKKNMKMILIGTFTKILRLTIGVQFHMI